MPFVADAAGNPNPSWRCLMPKEPETAALTCAEVGILGSVVGVLGTLSACEVLKLITGVGQPLIGRLLMSTSATWVLISSTTTETLRHRRSGRLEGAMGGQIELLAFMGLREVFRDRGWSIPHTWICLTTCRGRSCCSSS